MVFLYVRSYVGTSRNKHNLVKVKVNHPELLIVQAIARHLYIWLERCPFVCYGVGLHQAIQSKAHPAC